ncbi:MAG: acyl-ACP--UDP-N-acetylglucosamine O-acyltransferase [Azospirillaceae bacterium]|nr:acyl-ACP--UDP-N-acetylglucosamine O-acyltransferase [Azospirillaceae bacterium]
MVHPTSIVDPAATLGGDVEIGPYCVIGPDVELGDGVRLESHVVVQGRTKVGARTRIFPFASIGHEPQDRKYAGEASSLEIGEDCVIREHVTINPGTAGGGMVTRVGARCLILTGAHIAHDCQIGVGVTIVNQVLLGGHIVVGDYAVLGGGAAIHQFVRIGRHAMIGGLAGVEHDVIPFGLVLGNRARLQGLNLIGLKRHGFSREEIRLAQDATAYLFGPGIVPLKSRAAQAAGLFADGEAAMEIVRFAQDSSRRSLVQAEDGAFRDVAEPVD